MMFGKNQFVVCILFLIYNLTVQDFLMMIEHDIERNFRAFFHTFRKQPCPKFWGKIHGILAKGEEKNLKFIQFLGKNA
jgi:hypothetical protein